MKQAEWERLLDGFESYDLLTAVDAVDRLRNHLGDDEDGRPPELRTDLLRLHQLTMSVMASGDGEEAEKLFNLAADLDLQVFEIIQELEKVQATLERLMDLAPQSGDENDEEDE